MSLFDDARPSAELRVLIYSRDRYRCLRCDATEDLQLDHVKPWVFGGLTVPSNLQTLCGPCNRWKGTQEIDYRTRPRPRRGFDLDLSGMQDWLEPEEGIGEEGDGEEDEPLTPGEILRLSFEQHRIWRLWVHGDLPGFPDDETALDRAQALVHQRILDERTE